MLEIARKLPRIVKFGVVGALCLGIQLLILRGLEQFLPAVAANAIGFTVSAQLNFVLSRHFTWGDSPRKGLAQFVVSWISFNSNVILAVSANSAIFGVAHHTIGVPSLVAATLATAVTTTSTFLINHYVVFRPRRGVSSGHSTEASPEHGVLHASSQRRR